MPPLGLRWSHLRVQAGPGGTHPQSQMPGRLTSSTPVAQCLQSPPAERGCTPALRTWPTHCSARATSWTRPPGTSGKLSLELETEHGQGQPPRPGNIQPGHLPSPSNSGMVTAPQEAFREWAILFYPLGRQGQQPSPRPHRRCPTDQSELYPQEVDSGTVAGQP